MAKSLQFLSAHFLDQESGFRMKSVVLLATFALLVGFEAKAHICDQTLTSRLAKANATTSLPPDDLLFRLSRIQASIEDVWQDLLGPEKVTPLPRLILYDQDQHTSDDGLIRAGYGARYSIVNKRVYYSAVAHEAEVKKFGFKSDLFAAFILAHEFGHHIQNKSGIFENMDLIDQKDGIQNLESVEISIETQADCYAGVWLKQAMKRGLSFDANEFFELMKYLNAIGDTATHGSSTERIFAFQTGFHSGSPLDCRQIESVVLLNSKE